MPSSGWSQQHSAIDHNGRPCTLTSRPCLEVLSNQHSPAAALTLVACCRAHLRVNEHGEKPASPEELWAEYNRAGGRLTADEGDVATPVKSKRRQRMSWRCARPACAPYLLHVATLPCKLQALSPWQLPLINAAALLAALLVQPEGPGKRCAAGERLLPPTWPAPCETCRPAQRPSGPWADLPKGLPASAPHRSQP